MSSLEQTEKTFQYEQVDPKPNSIDDAPMDEWSKASRRVTLNELYPTKEELDKAQHRKQRPVYSGVLKYFPLAIQEVAYCSWLGQQQHNPGKPLAWDRSKSADELDAWLRHLMDGGDETLIKDTDGAYHMAKEIWRRLAQFEKMLEAENGG